MSHEFQAAVESLFPFLVYKAEFVPFSKSRNAGQKNKSLNWKCTFTHNGHTFTTDYSQGVGHIPGYKHGRNTIHQAEVVAHAVEKGCGLLENSSGLGKGRSIPAPLSANVLHCLVMDSEALDHPTFETWASDFGYDADSRKAESIYRACVETGLHLRRLFGNDLDKLREALAEM